MVCLDSTHTHDHVLAELRAYVPLVTPGCWCVVFDKFVDVPKDQFANRPQGSGDNPKTAVRALLAEQGDRFLVDQAQHDKLQITVTPDDFLRRQR